MRTMLPHRTSRSAPPVGTTGAPRTEPGALPRPDDDPFGPSVAAWVAAGLISEEQGRAIRGYVSARGATAPRSTAAGPGLVVEALGYLGGVIMLVGAGILIGVSWTDLSTPARLVLTAATAIALIGAGAAVPDRLGEAAVRLRAVLWAVGVAVTAAFLGVLAADVWGREDYHALVVVGPGTAPVAAALWWRRPTWLQQLALLVPMALAAAGVALEITSGDDRWGGAAVWLTGAAVALAAHARTFGPRTTGVAFGALAAVVGTLTMDDAVGIVLGLVTAVAVVALALAERSLPWLGVGAISLLYTTPPAAEEWFPGRLSAAVTFIVAGALLVAAALWVARRPRT